MAWDTFNYKIDPDYAEPPITEEDWAFFFAEMDNMIPDPPPTDAELEDMSKKYDPGPIPF